MQTRKRAKSVSFGKKTKEKPEKEAIKKIVEDETDSAISHVASEKAEVVERRSVHEKPQADELSATPPKDESEEVASDVETPSNEFVTDSPISTSPELPKQSKEEPVVVTGEQTAESAAEGSELSQPVEPPAQSSPSATPEQGQQAGSEELSSTLPPSAFTIQANEQPAAETTGTAASAPEGEKKKRFGLYFIVVAFLSFVLGLGAMAAASYFGLVNSNLPKVPITIPMIGVLGQKPTPTAPPPTVKPTVKPVDAAAFTISVLNGSGISGKAATVKTSLTTDGFKVTSTGNADNSNFTKTVIAAKKSVDPAFLTKLEDELKKSFTVDTIVTTIPDSSPTDVTVTLGSDTAQ
jgi:hypothetical protein